MPLKYAMSKQIIDFKVIENNRLSDSYSLLKLTPMVGELPDIYPGQFVQVQVKNSATTYLRRPISVHFVDYATSQLWLLVRRAGEGTEGIIKSEVGSTLNLVLPLGGMFDTPSKKDARLLLIGGGVGVAPMLYFGAYLVNEGYKPEFLLAAKSEADLLQIDEFKKYGTVHISTDDGSVGERGLVTQHSVLKSDNLDFIYCCGPMPMMKGVAAIAKELNVECEVSLENLMACGVGACLCCVEDTVDSGHVCVCTEGAVFNIKRLKW